MVGHRKTWGLVAALAVAVPVWGGAQSKGGDAVGFTLEPSKEVANLLRQVYAADLSEAQNYARGEAAKLYVAEIDLNDDGVNELITRWETPFFCGTLGCRIDVIRRVTEPDKTVGLREVGRYVAYGVSVLPGRTNGYRDLLVGDKNYQEWDGRAYVLRGKKR